MPGCGGSEAPVLVERLGGCPTPTTGQVSGGDRHLNFYGNRDNLQQHLQDATPLEADRYG